MRVAVGAPETCGKIRYAKRRRETSKTKLATSKVPMSVAPGERHTEDVALDFGPVEVPSIYTQLVTVRYEFVYEGGKQIGKGGTGTLFVDGKKVAEGKIGNTVGLVFSADETADVGVDYHTPVSPEYPQHGNEFTGKINKVTIELKDPASATR